MEELIPISYINDFTFCPVSIYFHELMGRTDRMLFQTRNQINGSASHRTIDSNTYSSKKNVLQGVSVCSMKYGLIGKIDVFDIESGTLIERKKHVSKIYQGHIFQLYGQYFSMIEEGYDVKRLQIHSMDDNKTYDIPHPSADEDLLNAFESTISDMQYFEMNGFEQDNISKCEHCIYSTLCVNTRYHDDSP